MRKKSHILLGRYLADQMSEVYSLQQHRKAFCLGNIMPDLKPSFLTTRHEFFGTFDHLQNKMRALVEKNPEEENARVYWRRFGEVMHYMADYFTFPHNKTYKGNLAAHNSYEAELKNRLRECILSGAADSQLEEAKQFESFEELVEYIRERHAYYLESPRCIADDIISVSVMHIIWKARGALPMTSVLSFGCAIRLYREFFSSVSENSFIWADSRQ